MVVRAAGCGDAAAVARIHVDAWRATYRGLVPDAYLAALSYARREEWWRGILCDGGLAVRRQCAFVADEPGGEVAGFAHGGLATGDEPDFQGELYSLYLLPTAQRRGTGRALLTAVMARLAADGVTSLLAWVLAENQPARRFYEALGGVPVRSRTIEIGGAMLAEVAYGWSDTRAVVGRADEAATG